MKIKNFYLILNALSLLPYIKNNNINLYILFKFSYLINKKFIRKIINALKFTTFIKF
jgi:hypothetical protein